MSVMRTQIFCTRVFVLKYLVDSDIVRSSFVNIELKWAMKIIVFNIDIISQRYLGD